MLTPADFHNAIASGVSDGKLDLSSPFATFHILLDAGYKPISIHNIKKYPIPRHDGYRLQVSFNHQSSSKFTFYHRYVLKQNSTAVNLPLTNNFFLQLDGVEFWFQMGWGEEVVKKDFSGYTYSQKPITTIFNKPIHFRHFSLGERPDFIFPKTLDFTEDFLKQPAGEMGRKGFIARLRSREYSEAYKILFIGDDLPFELSNFYLTFMRSGSVESFVK